MFLRFIVKLVPNMASYWGSLCVLPSSDSVGGVGDMAYTTSIYFFQCLLVYVEESLFQIYSLLNENILPYMSVMYLGEDIIGCLRGLYGVMFTHEWVINVMRP